MRNPCWVLYHIRDNKDSDIFEGIEEIIESKETEWCYRCASLCMKDVRIPPTDRPKYTIKCIEVLFEKYDKGLAGKEELELIIRFIWKVVRKPAYKEYINSKKDIRVYEKELADIIKREEEEYKERAERYNREHPMPIDSFLTDGQKYTHLVRSITSLDKKSEIVANERVPYFSYKFIKEVLKTPRLSPEIKKALVIPHADYVFQSGDEAAIEKLSYFLQYKPLYQEYVQEKNEEFWFHPNTLC